MFRHFIVRCFIILICILLVHGVCFADRVTDENIIQKAKDFVKNLNVDIKDVYNVPFSKEIYMIVSSQGQLFYWSPNGYIIFGDIVINNNDLIMSYNENFKNKIIVDNIQNIDISKAIKIGNGDKKVISFINLNCPYCKQGYEHLLNKNVTQYLFLSFFNENEEKMFYQIVCSQEPQQTVEKIFNKIKDVDIKVSDECINKNKEMFNYHKKLTQDFLIDRVPIYIINNHLVTGLNKTMIDDLLK